MEGRGTLFREIHKNTWLKRVTIDNRKIPVGTKKPERYWVVFCVHDDCEALLEGYMEPRFAASHSPDWTVSLQTALHISHTLVPSEHEYEFVITLSSDTVRFNASSWEIMQEWVDTLRLKLREMKILSPKENLYSKLPELRPPLLPTRDPMSPLPATPPVPAAIVPGVERVVNTTQTIRQTVAASVPPIQATVATHSSNIITTSTASGSSQSSASEVAASAAVNDYVSTELATSSSSALTNVTTMTAAASITTTTATISSSLANNPIPSTSMSNTLTQNLIKMLSNPVSTYSHQVNSIYADSDSGSGILSNETDDSTSIESNEVLTSLVDGGGGNEKANVTTNENISSLARTFASNVLADPNTCASSSGLSSYVSPTKRESTEDLSSLDSSPSSICPTPEPIVIPRPHTTRSNKGKKSELSIDTQASSNSCSDTGTTNITIIQVSSPIIKEKNNFPPALESKNVIDNDAEKYANNVQIIPSNFTQAQMVNENAITTVQVTSNTTNLNYSKVKKTPKTEQIVSSKTKNVLTTTSTVPLAIDTIADAANVRSFGAITNISIGAKKKASNHQTVQAQTHQQQQPQHYEQVFVTQTPMTVTLPSTDVNQATKAKPKLPFVRNQQKSASQTEIHVNRIKLNKMDSMPSSVTTIESNNGGPSSSAVTFSAPSTSSNTNATNNIITAFPSASSSQSTKVTSSKVNSVEAIRETGNGAMRRPLLTRGLTEAVILRPSRKDANMLLNRFNSKGLQTPGNGDAQANLHRSELTEQRKRSSSTSDTQGLRNRSNNNYIATSGNNNSNGTSNNNNINNNAEFRRAQASAQPFRPNAEIPLHASGRLTLREQQVMQLRREMMHPGGVRIQLRRKDCISSIAFVDAFGAAWISGWKQKEHPMLYNALHIGDQIMSITGIAVTNAKEANKVINNSTGQFIEFIIRRVPFGRVYAIRRDIDKQCLGLIRDGNTATIVDVVPNSLSARHGLPPKAQSCDGLSLTFWVLTEINGRPLNLFFKDNEVRDRLNAVGRDISILVQPSDLVSKLKKQLKSLRSYKDYIVQ